VKRAVFLAEARAEALDTFRWYESQRRGLGSVFRSAMNTAVEACRKCSGEFRGATNACRK
jgi:hypothetical protein